MKKKTFMLITYFCYFAMCTAFAQHPETDQSDEIIIANKNILYNLTEVVNKNGDMINGFLFGLKSDSVIIIRNEKK